MIKAKGIENRFALRYQDDEPDEPEPIFNVFSIFAIDKVYLITTTAEASHIEKNVKYYNKMKHNDIEDFVALLIDEGFKTGYELLSKVDYSI